MRNKERILFAARFAPFLVSARKPPTAHMMVVTRRGRGKGRVTPWWLVRVSMNTLRRVAVSCAGVAAACKLGAAATMTGSMLLSLLVYAYAFGSHFAIGLVLLLLCHELGHVAAAAVVGLEISSPLFIPFLGALVNLKRPPHNAKAEANLAIGGPALGTIAALLCLVAYLWTDSLLMLVLAYTGSLFNLFNLIPCLPLDGGRIAAAISPKAWLAGSIIVGATFLRTYNPLLLAVFAFSLLKLWYGEDAAGGAYYDTPPRQRLRVAMWYFGLLAVLGVTTLYTMELLY